MGKGLKSLTSMATLGLSDDLWGKTTRYQNAMIADNNAAVQAARGAVGQGYNDLKSKYIQYGKALDPLDSAQYGNFQNQMLGSLGTGYQKATESIAPQLQGEVQPLVNQYLNEILPNARSAAIDQGAYGGSRDMLTRERLTKDLQDTIANQAAADIKDQRAQYGQLTAADANNLSTWLSSLTAKTDLQNQQSDYLYNAALNYANALSGAGTTQAKNSGLDTLLNGAEVFAKILGAVVKAASV